MLGVGYSRKTRIIFITLTPTTILSGQWTHCKTLHKEIKKQQQQQEQMMHQFHSQNMK